jgi:hypothetical protein
MARVKNILIIVNTPADPPAEIADLGGRPRLWQNRVGDNGADFERLR